MARTKKWVLQVGSVQDTEEKQKICKNDRRKHEKKIMFVLDVIDLM